MKRMLPQLLLVIACAGCTPDPVIHKVVNAATAADPIVIAVLSDHYTDAGEFDNDVANFITYGLLAHPYYSTRAGQLQIESFYLEADYGFDVEVPSQNCALSWQAGNTPDTSTLAKVMAVVGGINPRHTIVIGDHPYNIGCTEGEWTYVGVDAVGGDVLPHELGHGLGLLWDEFALWANRNIAHPGLSNDPDSDRNCHHVNPNPAPPWTYAGSGSVLNCDLFGLDVVHAYNHTVPHNGNSYCLMGATHNAQFCPVCQHYMDLEFGVLRNPELENPDVGNPDTQNPSTQYPPPAPPSNVRIIKTAFVQPPPVTPGTPIAPGPVPPTATRKPVPSTDPKPIVRLVVSFDPENGTIIAKKGFPVRARYTPSHRRLSDYVYEILDGTQTIEVGVLNARLFRSHSYQGGPIHQTSPAHRTDVTIQLPDLTAEIINNRNISIRIWRLLPGVKDTMITPSVFGTLRSGTLMQPRGEVSPAQLRAVM